ncbi:MAG: hypothetical protein ACT4N8_10060, partial [Sphingosinicella sp.]
MPSRPFTRRQALQNRRFLEALALTGKARAAARALGVHRSTYTKRRAKCAVFAQNWDAALAIAHANINEDLIPPRDFSGRGTGEAGGGATSAGRSRPRTRTRGEEPITVRLASGRLQLRRAPPGAITAEAEDAFLDALAQTANIRLSAHMAGFTHVSFLGRRRADPEFAAAVAEALAEARADFARATAAAIEAARAPWIPTEADLEWPEGLTVDQALRAIRAPPLKLPCTPFPK